MRRRLTAHRLRPTTTAHHVAQHIKNHHIGVFKQVMLFEQLHRLTHHITTAACACRRAACFYTHHTVVTFKDKVFNAQFFSVKVNCFKHVNDGG